MVFIVNGVYKITRTNYVPGDTYQGTLKEIRNGIDYLINLYGLEATIDEDYNIHYVDDATKSEIDKYLLEQGKLKEKEAKLSQKKEKEERKLYEKLKKKYENT